MNMGKINKSEMEDICTEYDLFFSNLDKSFEEIFNYYADHPTLSFKDENIKPPFIYKKDYKEGSGKHYRPLPDYLTIKESRIDGLGVFATEDIGIETIFHCYTHLLIKEPNIGNELQRVNFGGFINHSKTPNCTLEMVKKYSNNNRIRSYYKVKSIRNIKAEEEITLDYTKELCGLSGYDGADFLKEDKIEDRVYESSQGVKYYYNPMFGKFESSDPIKSISLPVFYTPADADRFLKRIK